LVYAKVTENDGDFDPVQASRMSVLLPHHRDAKKLRARVNKLVDEAVKAFPVPNELDEASGWVRALRLYAEQLRTKKSTSVKKKRSSDDDEDSVDDEPIVYDDREMEVDTSLGRTRLETQTERRASEPAAAPWDDDEEVDDRWSDRRTFKGRAEVPAPEPAPGRLKRMSEAANDSEEEFDFEAPASPAAAAAPTPKTAPKRRRVVVEDEED